MDSLFDLIWEPEQETEIETLSLGGLNPMIYECMACLCYSKGSQSGGDESTSSLGGYVSCYDG